MIDLINASIIPFIAMFVLSIALIICVCRSRMNFSTMTRRDNRFAVSAISINIMFFVLTFPLILYDVITYSSSILVEFAYVMYYAYYGFNCFYIQLIVNRDFRDEFLRLMNLKVIKNVNTMRNTDLTRSNLTTLSLVVWRPR